jgi:hypothetical protein
MDIHDWFSLTYAFYLVLPRSILQSMPEEWQERFVVLMQEMGVLYECPLRGSTYAVNLRDDESGRFINDPLCDYERGRRFIKPNVKGG